MPTLTVGNFSGKGDYFMCGIAGIIHKKAGKGVNIGAADDINASGFKA